MFLADLDQLFFVVVDGVELARTIACKCGRHGGVVTSSSCSGVTRAGGQSLRAAKLKTCNGDEKWD
jgi:hypothetical protein